MVIQRFVELQLVCVELLVSLQLRAGGAMGVTGSPQFPLQLHNPLLQLEAQVGFFAGFLLFQDFL